HQCLDHVGAALGHAVGEFLDRDRLGNDDVAHDLRLLAAHQALPFALAGAAHRGEASGALAGILVEGAGNGQLAAAALILGAARLLLLDLAARLFLGPDARLLSGACLLLATAIGFGERGPAAGFIIGLARILQDAYAGRVLLGGQRASATGRTGRAAGRGRG